MENQTQKPTEIKPKIQFNPFSLEIERVIYTTNSQLEIWTDCILGGDEANKAYNLSISLLFKGNLIEDIFEKAVNNLIQRHECLRATFSPNGRFMCIYEKVDFKICYDDFSDQATSDKEISVENLIKNEIDALFDLVNGPLFKVCLSKLDEFEFMATFTHHHIIGDGLSFDIIMEELAALYSAYLEEKEPTLPIPERFSDYACRINTFSESEDFKIAENFWVDIYKESVPVIELPIDYPRPSIRTYDSRRMDFPLDDKIISALKKIGLESGSSLVTTLLSAFEIFICKITGQNDIVIGFPSSGNSLYDMRQLIGDCVNLLPLRTKINPNINFKDYLKERNSQLFDAYENQQISFGELLKNIPITRDSSRVPLVPVILTVDLNRDIESEFSFTGLTHELILNPRLYATFEIQLHIFRTKKGPSFQWSYNSTLFKKETIVEMMASFEDTINQLLTKPNDPLSEFIAGNHLNEYDNINNTTVSYPNVTLNELLKKQLEITPNNIALEFYDSKTTYQELHEKVDQLAHYLKANGVQTGDFVAVSFSRSPELLYVLLAITQCGAAYLPLDPEYPNERLEFMLTDSGARVLITSKAMVNELPTWPKTILIEDAITASVQYAGKPFPLTHSPEDFAYILYTSGSTGKPKGVPITHKNLVNLLCSMTVEPGIVENDKLLSITTISFDIAGVELYLPLISGATIVLADHETTRDGRLLLDLIKKEKISILQATPVTWSMLLDSGWNEPLPIKALCGGEAMSIDLAKALTSKCDSLWNVYGPTETTIYSTRKQISSDDKTITIGKPIANTQIYIIDENGLLVAPGNIGEIVIGGDGVAKGYWNRPELTSEKFIQNRFSDNSEDLIYRTGDLGRLLPNHEIECLGRVDQQVKIHGVRIEPGEVEQALLELEGIKTAVVLATDDFLIAHVVVESDIENSKKLIESWQETLSSRLPKHLIPRSFNILDKMPTTLNGKIDRKALSQYQINKKINYTEPRTNEEKIVANVWKESLNLDRIDIFSNFFEMGGHSINGVKVMVEIEKITGKRIPLSSLFKYSTVEKFAKLIEEEKDHSINCIVPIKPNGNKVPLFIVHGAGLNVLNFVGLCNHFDAEQPVYGIQGTKSEGYKDWYDSIEAMAAHYVEKITTINPEGPYAVGGFSFGGVVAFEMTRQLRELGKTVTMTAILDSHLDDSYYYRTYKQKRLIRYLNRTQKRWDYLKEMLTSWQVLKSRINSKKKYILEKHLGIQQTPLSEQEALALEKFIEADKMVQTIVDKYQIKPQNFSIELFRSKDNLVYKTDPVYLGWKKAALGGITIHEIAGNHLDIVLPPNDKILAKLIQDILDQKHGNI